ncbi:MAG: HEPN domain-containing protein [Planctomycetes bacterium]|nr:HEPN domain-containing protein [Planctomycetota bacterium]
MPNRALAKEWLVKSYHDLSSAEVLYNAGHFTDSIGFDLQQSIEKSLKSLFDKPAGRRAF